MSSNTTSIVHLTSPPSGVDVEFTPANATIGVGIGTAAKVFLFFFKLNFLFYFINVFRRFCNQITWLDPLFRKVKVMAVSIFLKSFGCHSGSLQG